MSARIKSLVPPKNLNEQTKIVKPPEDIKPEELAALFNEDEPNVPLKKRDAKYEQKLAEA